MFQIPIVPTPSAIASLANRLPNLLLDDADHFGEIEFPIRTAGNIVSLTNKNEESKISPIDWLMLFCDSNQWKDISDSKLENSCYSLWKAICNNPIAIQIAANSLLRHQERESELAQPKMLDVFIGLNSESGDNLKLPHRLNIVSLIIAQEWWKIARSVINENKSFDLFFESKSLILSDRVYNFLVKQLNSVVHLDKNKHVFWFVDRLAELEDQELKQTLEKFQFKYNPANHNSIPNKKTIKYDASNIPEKIASWLGENCDSERQVAIGLNSHSRKYISSISKLPHYDMFKSIVRVLTSIENLEILGFTNRDKGQLNNRERFFSNYQTQMTELKVYLPKSSFEIVKDALDGYEDYIMPFEDSSPLEIGIFKVKTFVCVEVFRSQRTSGDNEDTFVSRFYALESDEGQKLLSTKFVKMVDILSLSPIFTHDHRKFWESSLEEKIRSTFDVYLDSQINRLFYGFYYDENNKYTPMYKKVKDRIPESLTETELILRAVETYSWNKDFKELMYDIVLDLGGVNNSKNFGITYANGKKIAKVKVYGFSDLDDTLISRLNDKENYFINRLELPSLGKEVLHIRSKQKIEGRFFEKTIGEVEAIEKSNKY